jgi:hypothetical protein
MAGGKVPGMKCQPAMAIADHSYLDCQAVALTGITFPLLHNKLSM